MRNIEEIVEVLQKAAGSRDGIYKLYRSERRNRGLRHQIDLAVEAEMVYWCSAQGGKSWDKPYENGKGLIGVKMRINGYRLLDEIEQCKQEPTIWARAKQALKWGTNVKEVAVQIQSLAEPLMAALKQAQG